ncbi:MAG TPA: barstar family protein [Paucimonas sp.]|nr:barstar family protein [Paucimonas sp.]
MATVRLDGSKIGEWAAFHAECRREFGFPDFYGNNMDAWIDCLSYLRDDDGMCRFRLGPDEMLRIEVSHAAAFRARAPEIAEELSFCVEAINDRYADYGEKPALELVFLD